MHRTSTIARRLATAFTAGTFDVEGLVEQGSRLFGRRWRWLRPLARRLHAAYPNGSRPPHWSIVDFLRRDVGFRRACASLDVRVVELLFDPPPMQPAGAVACDLPTIRTPGELADWLDLSHGELSWFADCRGLEAKCSVGRLRHYHYRVLPKRRGQLRLIEVPKTRLKAIQRRILNEVVNHVPPHVAAHGFRRGRSVASFVAPHVARCVVLRFDLQDFFPSISAAWIAALFRTIGYPERVAGLLAGLCTNTAPSDTWDTETRPPVQGPPSTIPCLYGRPHLPQGAPTSPALANLCAFRLDCRLAALANSAGATYTRYADDLAFSGDCDFARIAHRFRHHVAATVLEEGFEVQHRKTRIMRQGVRQQLAGIVVNECTNVPRGDYERLKATLTNCVRHGPASQNRTAHADQRAHLLGRISFVEMFNANRGARLRRIFDQIDWDG